MFKAINRNLNSLDYFYGVSVPSFTLDKRSKKKSL